MKIQESSLIDATYNKILHELDSNNYAIGTKLQPIRALAKKFNVSYLTAQKAIKAMQMQGTLEARPGDGLYVIGKPKPLTGGVAEFINKPENKKAEQQTPSTENYTVGVVMPFWLSNRGSGAVYEIVRGLVSESDKFQWSVELIHNSGFESEHPDFLKKIESRNFNGIVWLQPTIWHKMNLMRLIDKGYDLVATGRRFEDVPAKYVQFDHADMAVKVVDYLQKKNAKKTVVLSGPIERKDGCPNPDPYSVDVVNAIKSELKTRGCDLKDENICQAFWSRRHDLIIADFLKNNNDIDAIICLHEPLTHDIENLLPNISFTSDKTIPLIDISGIFNIETHEMQNVEIVGMSWPLLNMGKAIARHLRSFQDDSQGNEPLDLSVEIN